MSTSLDNTSCTCISCALLKPRTSPPAAALIVGRWQARSINEPPSGLLLAADIFHKITYKKVNKHEVAPITFWGSTKKNCEQMEMNSESLPSTFKNRGTSLDGTIKRARHISLLFFFNITASFNCAFV